MKKIVRALNLFIIAVILAFTMILSSCGTKNSEEIIIWWPSGKPLQNIMDDAISRYKEINPDVSIKVVKKTGMDVYDAYKFALNDNNSRPDIAILDHVYVQALANEGLLADLSAMGSDTDIKSLYPETVYAANTYNGKNYGLPLSANTVCLMYNKNILDAVGITKVPETYDELLAACEIVKNDGRYTPFAQPFNDTFAAMEFTSYVARVNGQLVSDDYRTVKLDSDEVKDAVNKWVALSKYASTKEYEEGKFYNGSVAFIEMGSWNLSKVTGTTALFNCGVAEIVSIDSTLNYSGLGLYSFVVSEKSSKKAAAYDFAKFLSTDTKFQLAFAQEKDLLPVTISALNDSYYTSDPILSVYASQLTKVASRPGTAAWPALEKQIVNMLYSSVTATDANAIAAAISNAQLKAQEETNRKYGK